MKSSRSSVIRSIGLLLGALELLDGAARGYADEPAADPSPPAVKIRVAPPKGVPLLSLVRRVAVPVESNKFGEGWRQTLRPKLLKLTPDTYEAWVEDGWLRAKRTSEQGLEWHIILAQVVPNELPQLALLDVVGGFELSYAGGRYFIRDNLHDLRCVRQRKDRGPWITTDQVTSPRAAGRLHKAAVEPPWTFSSWHHDQWLFVACGPDADRFDVVVRLNPAENEGAGWGLQTAGGGFGRYFHGDTSLVDDGELLVAHRMLKAVYDLQVANKKTQGESKKVQQAILGTAAPAIEASAWLNAREALPWEKLKGQVVLVDFWGVWCGACVEKLGKVQEFADRYAKRGVVVIGVHSLLGAERCAEFVELNKLTFPIAMDTGATAKKFGVLSWPSVFLIDKTGKVVIAYRDQVPSDEEIETLLNQ